MQHKHDEVCLAIKISQPDYFSKLGESINPYRTVIHYNIN